MAKHLMIFRLGFGNARDGFLRDNENVDGCLRVNVIESDNKVILVNDEIGRASCRERV